MAESITKVFHESELSTRLPWVEKYRPKKFDQITSHREIIGALRSFLKRKNLPHLLFFGPSGCGKTSTIMCCANEVYGQFVHCMVLRLNASNERGIDTVRTKIKDFISNKNSIFLPPQARQIFKLVILDEIDSMTVEAQGMLRQTIEKNSSSTRFCLICNDIDKINIALQSRCTLFRFSPLSFEDVKHRLLDICRIEGIKYVDESIEAIIKITKGDMRSAINTLQHVKLASNGELTIKHVYKISGYCMPAVINNIFSILMTLANKNSQLEKTVNLITEIVMENNITIFNLLDQLKNIVIESNINIEKKIYLIDHFARIEVHDSVNVDSRVLIAIITSLFLFV